MTFKTRTQATFAPPVMEARRWIAGASFPDTRPLINVSQAAPVDPPPQALRRHMADTLLNDPAAHLYGPVLGLPALRAAVAASMTRHYAGEVSADQVAITAGCNEAFAAAMTALTTEGDAVLLPAPWYFNHKMWLDMAGIEALPLTTDASLLPDIEAARAAITPRTRAIVLVTPNNPGGVEYPASLVAAFSDLARAHGLTLVIDETYRDFDSRAAPPHDLFRSPDWHENVIQLYSFSKAYRLTGHRVGAIATSADRLAEIEKFLDTVTICPPQLGQHAALWGMENLGDWLAGERLEILDRRAAIADQFPRLESRGWRLMGLGAYFAYVEHPFDMASDDLCRTLVDEASVLALPGTMFRPVDDARGGRELRIAFANIDRDGIVSLFDRLAALPFARRTA